VVMTPKRYLRMPASRSPVEELVAARFHEVLADPNPPGEVRRIVLSTGKIAHELLERRDKVGAAAVVVRLEQLYPFPFDQVRSVLDAYPGADLLWVQEEPENMGAWRFVRGRLRWMLGEMPVGYVGREESGSPASGSAAVHDREHEEIMQGAFGAVI